MKSSIHDERHQQLSMLRDQLRNSNSNTSLHSPMHTPRSSRVHRQESFSNGTPDIANLTPRRTGAVIGATTASHFKPVYD
jgi:hypothetical protein